ncbi:MAG: hypothetical protein IJ264_05685, partial [Clostridia bacterium]|nr:hypothetical protein [Clostridia bacterium]
KGLMPFTFDFGTCNFVDVRDVAKGMVAAAEKGGNGECYLLCGDLITVRGYMEVLAAACGRKPPKIAFKKDFVFKILPALEKLCELAKLPPMINDYSMRKTLENFNFSNQKARKELGFEPRDLQESFADTVKWLNENR